MHNYVEEWKPILGFEEIYAISNSGRLKRIRHRKNSGLSPDFLKPYLFKKIGYLGYRLFQDGKYTAKLAHSLVAEAFLGSRPENYDINHIDGIKTNNLIANLEYVTRSENVLHAQKLGLKAVGSEMKNAKLTEEKVHEMKMLVGKMSYADIARNSGVSITTAKHAINGKTWKHVYEEAEAESRKVFCPYSDITPAEIRSIGESLFGKFWRFKLAAALSVHKESVRHWMKGDHRVSHAIGEKIRNLSAM